MGRYDGEDFSEEYYANKRSAQHKANASNLGKLLLSLCPKRWQYFVRLKDLGYATYGGFSIGEAREALGRIKDKDSLLKEWERYGLFSIYPTPFRKDINGSAHHISNTGKALIEVLEG